MIRYFEFMSSIELLKIEILKNIFLDIEIFLILIFFRSNFLEYLAIKFIFA